MLAHGVHVNPLGTFGGPALTTSLHPPQPLRHRTDLEEAPGVDRPRHLQGTETLRQWGRGRYRFCWNQPHVDLRYPGLSMNRHETRDGSTSVQLKDAEIVELRLGQIEPPEVARSETRHDNSKVDPRSRHNARRLRAVNSAALCHGVRGTVATHRSRWEDRDAYLVWLDLTQIALGSRDEPHGHTCRRPQRDLNSLALRHPTLRRPATLARHRNEPSAGVTLRKACTTLRADRDNVRLESFLCRKDHLCTRQARLSTVLGNDSNTGNGGQRRSNRASDRDQ